MFVILETYQTDENDTQKDYTDLIWSENFISLLL